MTADQFRLEIFQVNDIKIRTAVAGEGSLIIMVHGFPELWYSWRHQIDALAKEGFMVVAPDVRGYGGSDKPPEIASYDMLNMTKDVVDLIAACGKDEAILIGHDWGAPICWNTAALHPGRVSAVIGLSVPFRQRGEISTIELWRKLYEGKFFYQLYFQKEGVAEAEFEKDIGSTLRKFFYFAGGDCRSEELAGFMQKGPESNMLDGLIDPNPFPPWLNSSDLQYFIDAFREGGFGGPLNRYRVQQRDWENLPQLSTLKVTQPSYFIAGSKDPVRNFVPGMDLFEDPGQHCSDFRGETIIPGRGHWIQQEAPHEVNTAILEFLKNL